MGIWNNRRRRHDAPQKHGRDAHPRCGAKTRSGEPCKSPAANGKHRCRMHGGAERSGAPQGNQNALKHGLNTTEITDWKRAVKCLVRDANKVLEDL